MGVLRKSFLNGTAFVVLLAASSAVHAADVAEQPASPSSGLTWDGVTAEFGGQGFITKPGNTPGNSAAKFNQYGDRTEPVFLDFFKFGAHAEDGSLRLEGLGQNVGTNNQAYEFGIWQPGQQYFDYTWSSVPNLRSNTAMTIFGGVGTNNLTVPSSVVQQLYYGIFNNTNPTNTNATYNGGVGTNSGTNVTNQIGGTPTASFAKVPNGCLIPGSNCATGVVPVQTTILNNEKPLTLGIQRDRQDVEYKWTPDGSWTVKVDYSHDHRYGVQEQGFLFSSSTSTPMAAVPMPINDTTDNASISAEYYGLSPWGMKWNGMIKYDLSLYRDAFTQYSVENPFGGPASPAGNFNLCPIASTSAVNNCYGFGTMDTAPNNAANSIMAQAGVDLPGFRSNRFMTTLQYSDMRQNAAFTPMTVNPGILGNFTTYAVTGGTAVLVPVPRGSLDGQVDTFLSNNVLTTQLTPELKNKLSYRYYSYDNNTPMLTMTNWIVNDAAIAAGAGTVSSLPGVYVGAGSVGGGSYAPHTTLFSSYTKQNAAEELVWSPVSWGSVGASGGWEGYHYQQYAVDATNEFIGKIYGHVTPTDADWLTVRATEQLSARRYDNYNWQSYIGNVMLNGTTGTGFVENNALVTYNISNRDRNAGNIYIDITTPIRGLTITPNAGYRWDQYPDDFGRLQAGLQQLGLKWDHSFNYGIETNWQVNSQLSLLGSVTWEGDIMNMIGDSNAANQAATYLTKMSERGYTLLAGMNYLIIPDKLSLKLSGTMANFRNDWDTEPVNCPATGALNGCGVVSPGNPAYPPEYTKFQRLDAILSYKVDPVVVNQMHLKDAILKLHWAYERNSVTNWQADSASPYLYQVLNSSTTAMKDMIFLAGNNPNYTAQLVALSAVVKW